MKMLLAFGLLAVMLVIIPVVNTHAGMVVDLNTAGPSQLETLYRVGPKLAGRIISEREKNGPFASLDDLAHRVRGIGPKMI